MRYNSKAGFTHDGEDLLISYKILEYLSANGLIIYTPAWHVREITS
jgi:hypothetical protein